MVDNGTIRADSAELYDGHGINILTNLTTNTNANNPATSPLQVTNAAGVMYVNSPNWTNQAPISLSTGTFTDQLGELGQPRASIVR